MKMNESQSGNYLSSIAAYNTNWIYRARLILQYVNETLPHKNLTVSELKELKKFLDDLGEPVIIQSQS